MADKTDGEWGTCLGHIDFIRLKVYNPNLLTFLTKQ